MMYRLRAISGTGYDTIESDVTCVLTRFEARSLWGLLAMYRSFRRVRAEARRLSGLITSLFVVEGTRTCYTLSVWRDEKAILEFNNTCRAHIGAGNACFGFLRKREGRAQLWSAQFRLSAVSACNLQWAGMDLPRLQRPMTPDLRSTGTTSR